jgi:hypothetical protein
VYCVQVPPTQKERFALFERASSGIARVVLGGEQAVSLAGIRRELGRMYPGYDHLPTLLRAHKALGGTHGDSGMIVRRQFRKFLELTTYFHDWWPQFEEVDPDGEGECELSFSQFVEGARLVGLNLGYEQQTEQDFAGAERVLRLVRQQVRG